MKSLLVAISIVLIASAAASRPEGCTADESRFPLNTNP